MSFQNLTRIQVVAFCHKTKLLSHVPVCSHSLCHVVPGKPRQARYGLGRECTPTTRTDFGANTFFAVKQSRKIEGHREKVRKVIFLVMENYNTCLTKLWTVWFQCHGNLQKDLQNGKTSLGGLYQLKHCYNKTRTPKIGLLNTRSSTSAILKSLKFSPQNCKKGSPTIKSTDSYLTFHQYKTGFLTSALLAASVVKTWKLQEKCISIDSTKQEWV